MNYISAGKGHRCRCAALGGKYYKRITSTDISRFLEDIPTVELVAATVNFLSDKGIPALICALAWDFVAEVFARRYGFVDWNGPVLVTDSKGVFIGGVLSDFHETDKPVFVNDYCERNGISMSGEFHVGESRSVLPLFGSVGFSVAFNGNSMAKAAASISVDSN